MTRVVALTSGRNVPSSRFRVRQFIAPLRALGIDVREQCPPIDKFAPAPSPLLAPAARAVKLASRLSGVVASRSADLVWLERELLPGRRTLEGLTGRPRLFDVDDALWLHGSPGFSDRIVRDCDGVIAGNEFIAAHYRGSTGRVWVVPTAVDTDVWTPRAGEGGPGFTVGWMGTSSNLPYLLPLQGALGRFLARRPEARLLIVSDRPPAFTDLPPERWRYVRWSAAGEVALLQQMDVGLMPLPNTDWARGKCAYKMLLYLAAGIPAVVSPVGTNLEVMAHGEVGIAARDPEEWHQALETLFLDRERASRMGRTGRQVVEAKYSVRQVAPRLAAIFREVAADRGIVSSPSTPSVPSPLASPRVVMVVAQCWPILGGAENQALRLAAELAAQGLAVEIWTGRWEPGWPAHETIQGVTLRRLGRRPWLPPLRRYAFMAALFARLLRRRRDYDLVHVHQVLYPAFAAACGAWISRRPCLARLSSTGVTCDFTVHARRDLGLQRTVTRRLLTRVVSPNRQAEADCRANGYQPAQIATIPNGVAVAEAVRGRPERDPVRVVYVGGLRAEKRVDLLLSAWLAAGCPGQLLIVGDGLERARLERLAAGCAGSVEFAGQIADPSRFYAEADVFALASDAEGMSNALLEAMAAGCACVATWVGGNIDLLGPEQQQPPPPGGFLTASAGLLVRTGDAAGLALALTTLCRSAPLRRALGDAAHRRCLAGYRLADVARRYRLLYGEMLAPGQATPGCWKPVAPSTAE